MRTTAPRPPRALATPTSPEPQQIRRPTVTVDPDEYRQAVGRLVTGVTVVTTVADGHDHAMTANAVSSVSLDPVRLLVCVEREARFHDAVISAGVWGVNILDADQRSIAAWLSTRGRPLHGQLDRVAHHRDPETGVALLDGSLATIVCRTDDTLVSGDHTIVVGDVVSLDIGEQPGRALAYFRGRFGTYE
ncbi:flavin reductase [Yimella sp. cx-51]|nr:flavin reductase family protein [Yimella sp. cx-51]MBC9956019.1 flavin reductase [Yimella sp. cx-51]QTH37444.1 flavin reductase [Yimella sp. cx-51]